MSRVIVYICGKMPVPISTNDIWIAVVAFQ
jgi:hypothetical protein